MFVVIQHSSKVNKHKLDSLLRRYGYIEYKFNEELILDDINKTRRLLDTLGSNAIHRKNLVNIEKYLKKLYGLSKKSTVQVNWVYDYSKERIKSVPIEIRKFKQYNIQTLDYMVKNTSVTLVNIDLTKLVDIISFESIYREEMTQEELEEHLGSAGIASIASSQVLEAIMGDKVYEKTLSLRGIKDTPYLSPEGILYNYFGKGFFKAKNYREAVESACNTAIAIVLQELLVDLENVVNTNNMKIAGVFEDSISLIFESVDERIEGALEEFFIIIKVFGRRFEIIPKIEKL